MLKKLTILILACFFVSVWQNALAEDYKYGIVLHLPEKVQDIDGTLDEIIESIADGDVYREDNNDSVHFLIQTEIPWCKTQENSGDEEYDFSKFIKYAEKLSQRGIKWTPLLNPHCFPSWIGNIVEYEKDHLINKKGENKSHNMKFSPFSKLWGKEAKNWIEKAIEALSPFIGLSKNDVISEILVTNEMAYGLGGMEFHAPKNDFSSYDEATKSAWKNWQDSYSDIPGENKELNLEDSEKINAFMKFRSEGLVTLLINLRKYVKDKLSSMGHKDIPVSWKLVPYFFDKGPETGEQFAGFMDDQLERLFSKSGVEFIGLNIYQGIGDNPENYINKGCDFFRYITTARRFDISNKSIYMAEFNADGRMATKQEIEEWTEQTKNGYNYNKYKNDCGCEINYSYYDNVKGAKYWTFYVWKDDNNIAGEEQKAGLKNAFDKFVPKDGYKNNPNSNIKTFENPGGMETQHTFSFPDEIGFFVPIKLKVTVKGNYKGSNRYADIYLNDKKIRILDDGGINGVSEKYLIADGSKKIVVKIKNSDDVGNCTDGTDCYHKIDCIFMLSDIPSDAWYKDEVIILFKKSIVNGYPDGSFKPAKSINRAEFVTILVKAGGEECSTLKPCQNSSPFDDVKDEKKWYYKYVQAAYNRGWLNNDEDHQNFRPDDPINRAEAATLLVTASRKNDDSFNHENIINKFEDVPEDKWYYDSVYKAQKYKIMTGYPDDSDNPADSKRSCFRPEADMNRAEASVAIVQAFPKLKK